MKTIIAGSRTITNPKFVELAIKEAEKEGIIVTEVYSGCARGPDSHAMTWAAANGIPIVRFWAAWGVYGKSAGMIRNVEMANHAQALIAVWDGKSKGTQHMIWQARKRKLKVFVLNVTTPDRAPALPSLTTGEFDNE